MEKFDERKKSFEKKFAHDEELKFKVASRRNKYLGEWVSQKFGFNEEKQKEAKQDRGDQEEQISANRNQLDELKQVNDIFECEM